jgi:hypothetical protein
MHISPTLIAAALLITTTSSPESKPLPIPSRNLPALVRPQSQNALKPFTPLRIQNEGMNSLTVKVIGPGPKILKLGPSENQVVLVTPGEYYCLYKFKGEPSEPFVFKKSGNFQVPARTPDKPGDFKVVVAAEEDRPAMNLEVTIREVKPSSAREFNDTSALSDLPAPAANNQIAANQLVGATPSADSTDSLRLQDLNLVVVVGDLFYGESPAEKAQQKRVVSAQLNQYVRGVLIPKLSRQGFKVKNLGVREEVVENPAEPTLVIDYSEAEGQAFSMYSGYGEPAAYGVEITCSLTLYHPSVAAGSGIWDATLVAVNDESIKMSFFADKEAVLHNQALKYLREQLNDLALDLTEWAPRAAAPGKTPSAELPGTTPAPTRKRPRRP